MGKGENMRGRCGRDLEKENGGREWRKRLRVGRQKGGKGEEGSELLVNT